MEECIQTEVLIIGCGIAGGTAALALADMGIPVTVVTRAKEPGESSTYYAQGGIIYEGKGDSPQSLAEDLFRAGAYRNNPAAVKILAEEGPHLVKEILVDKIGVNFDRKKNHDLETIREAAHSKPRIVHSADFTGQAIEIALLNKLKDHPKIQLLTQHTAVDLLTPEHHSKNRLAVYEPISCVGAYVLNQTEGKVIRCLAKKTILASGGLGQIFLRTTNPEGARGDGLAMAYRAGARVINCEFIQFHPTTFHKQGAPHFLISEAVRGAGAKLVREDGEPFMHKYDSEWKDLAPRDVVARSIAIEMIENNIPNVYLDLRSYISEEGIKEHFPVIHRECLKYGIDIIEDLVPVVVGAHYFCGGVWVDEWGRTTLEHLYAVGEVSCTGVHGANRLGSASLLEGLVWGKRAANHIQSVLPKDSISNLKDEISPWQDSTLILPDPVLIRQDMSSIQNIMWNYVGLIRTTPRLQRALRELRHLEIEIERFYRVTRLTDALIGLRNAVRAAAIVALAAWINKESIGCHYRE
jgi:L-aspartate oxidase